MPIIRAHEEPHEESVYGHLGLTNNPFPQDPIIRPRSKDARTNGSIFADGCRRQIITRFEDMLLCPKDFDNRARIALLWSEGDKESGRGTGKTALLQHFQHRVNKDWGQTEFQHFNAAVIYVAFPDQVDRLYSEQLAWSALLGAHESELIKTASASLRLRAVENRWPEKAPGLLAKIDEAEGAAKDGADVLFDANALVASSVSPEELEAAVVAQLVDAEIEEDVAQALTSDCLDQYMRTLRRDGKTRPFYVQRDTKGLLAAKDLLLDQLTKFLIQAGFRGAYIFIDDVENLTDQMTNKAAIEFAKEFGLAFLRPGRAAGDTRFYSAVLTTHLQAATKLAKGWSEAGLQAVARLDANADTSVCVPLPTQDGAVEMMEAYIRHHRKPGASVGKLHPFTEGAARRLVSDVRPSLHPRTFLQKAHYLVKAAVADGLDTIDENVVRAFFEKHGQHASSTQVPDVIEHEDY